MSGRGLGGWGARGVGFGLVFSLASESLAQSTARFPEPGGAGTPATPSAPAAPAATPAAASASAAPLSRAAQPPAVDASTDRRYPASNNPRAPSALALSPALLPYRAGLLVPPGYHVEHRSANGLIGGGLATLVVAYATALIVGASDKFENGTGWLALPVVGPWAAIGARSYSCDNDPLHANACVNGAFNEVQTIAILSADAVVQATGAVLFIAGLASGHDELVRDDSPVAVRFSPRALGTSGFGFGVDGRF